jgi:hypothetical protein
VRVIFYFLLVILPACVSYKKYRQEEIIEEKRDPAGRLVFKKYCKLTSNPSHDKLATITEEYDSLGRVIKSYGFDHPFFNDKNYLVENVYHDLHLYLSNKYI